MSSEVWRPCNVPLTEVDTRNGEVCKICPQLKKQRAVLDPADPSRVVAMVNICNDCGVSIPVYPNMGGNGYVSYAIDHLHLTEMGVRHPGRKIVNRQLCKECKAKDFAFAYPDVPIPAELRQ